jgi:hypothetical protein
VSSKFTLVLSREITNEELEILRQADAVCAGAVFGSDSLPTNADVPVTRMDIDDRSASSLAEAIQSALDAVRKVPELSVPSLTVPAQPARPADEDKPAVAAEGRPEAAAQKRPQAKNARGKKSAAGKLGANAS